METLFLVLSSTAVVIMLYALYSSFTLKSAIPGGEVKATWNILTGLIALFTAGYMTTPFFQLLPPEIKDLLVGLIFLSGAIFVVIVIKLFYKIVEDLGRRTGAEPNETAARVKMRIANKPGGTDVSGLNQKL